MTFGNHQQTAEALAADLYSGAKLILLTTDGTLTERISRAYVEMAVHATPLAEQIPGPLGRRIAAIHWALTGSFAGEGDVTQASLDEAVGTLSDDALVTAALEIASLADDLNLEVEANHAALRPSP